MTVRVRRIEAEEWREVKALRLRALADPAAPIAFLDTVENASAQSDEFWKTRSANAAGDAEAAQFVALNDSDEWIASLTVVPHREHDDAALVVGVYVAPEHRGRGAIEALFELAAEWAAVRGKTQLVLEVHIDNGRAQTVYERCGFVRSGDVFTEGFGAEYEMRRALVQSGSVQA